MKEVLLASSTEAMESARAIAAVLETDPDGRGGGVMRTRECSMCAYLFHVWALEVVAAYEALGLLGIAILQCEEKLRHLDTQLLALRSVPVTGGTSSELQCTDSSR